MCGNPGGFGGAPGQAIANIDEKIGVEVLEQLLQHYLGGTNNVLAKNLLAKGDNEVAIVLEPIKIFVWDFSNRMQDVSQTMLNLTTEECP